MHRMKRLLLAVIVTLVAGCLMVSAQGASSGTLVLGQPLPNQIEAGGILTYDYTVVQPSQVTIQALGDTVQPSISLLRVNTIVATQPNADGALTASLTTLLDPGTYVVQIGAANNTAGLVVVFLQSEVPISSTTLTPGALLNGVVNTAAPLVLYRFNALVEPAFLYVESASPSSGVSVQLVNTASGQISGQLAPDLLGGRWRIAPGSAAYQVEIRQSAAGSADAFTICFAAVSTGGCEAGSTTPPPPPTAQQPEPAPTVETTACIVTAAAAGGVNIRQSATTSSIIVGRLPNGVAVNALGISPDGQFFNIIYAGINGWVALSVVTSSGNCADVQIVNPPPIVYPPTATPAPTQPPTAAPPPTQSGPCLISIGSPTYVYTTTIADQSNLFDQLQGGELIPVGRLADNSWWKTNYNGAWIQTSTFGSSASLSGDCSNLPIVSP